MWLTAANVGFLAGGSALYLWVRCRLLVPGRTSSANAGLIAATLVALLGLLAFATAHLGMHASWTGQAALSNLRWLIFAVVFGGALLLAQSLLRLSRARAEPLLLPAVAFLVLLGLVNVYAWEVRDSNAYVSTVALPALRSERAAIVGDTTLSPTVRAEVLSALGPVPSERQYEAGGVRAATILDSQWLDAYNNAASRARAARAAFPEALDGDFEARHVDPDDTFRKQLVIASIGLLLVPMVFVAAGRMRGRRLSQSRFALLASTALVLGILASSVVGGASESLPPLLQIGGADVTVFEVLKLTLVLVVALAFGRIRTCRGRCPWAILGLAVAALAVLAMVRRDPGAGVALLAAGMIMTSLVAGRRTRIAIATAGAIALALVPIGSTVVDSSLPETVHVRLQAWADPWGTNHRAQLQNLVVGSLTRLASVDPPQTADGTEAVLTASNPQGTQRPPLVGDVRRIEQEFRWRLSGIAGAPTNDPFVPAESRREELILLEADRLWGELGGFAAVGSTADQHARFRARAELALSELRERARAFDGVTRDRGGTERATISTELTFAPDSFQLQRSLHALRQGGLLGTGIGQGRPEAIPDLTEDVPVAALGESFGFAGVGLLSLFALLLAGRGLRAAGRLEDSAASLLVAGLSVLLGLQALISIGGMSGALPFTGLTHPFISRSGTSLIANLVAVGIVLALVTRGTPEKDATAASTGLRRVDLSDLSLPAAFAVVLAGVAMLQLGGKVVMPGPTLAQLSENDASLLQTSNQWALVSYRATAGRIVDRHGQALVQTPDLGTTRSFPDPDLARTLSHALQRLDRSFRNRLLQPHGWVDGGVELVTTLDSDVQRALDRAIEQGATEGGVADVERLRGAAIVLDATDGSILALESRPAFSPSELSRPELWAAREAAERRDGFSYRHLNRVIDGRYPPGSVFKTVTAAGALELGLHDVDSKDFDYRSGELGPRRPDGIEHLGLWHRLELPDGPPIEGENHPHVHDWTFDLEQAFAYSCNIAFAEIGIELGATRLEQFATRFGFEQPLTVDGLGSSKSTLDGAPGVGVTERYVGESASAVARTAFGQGEMLATPLQIALIPAAVANGGTIMQPRIVDGIRDEDGTWLSRDEPRVLHETGLSETTLDGLRRLMEASVTYGIADTASISSGNAGPGVAGKTGSAEWTEEKALPHSWFIGYFPTEAPRLAIAVVVEESGAGAQVAARIARHVFEARAVQDFLESSG